MRRGKEGRCYRSSSLFGSGIDFDGRMEAMKQTKSISFYRETIEFDGWCWMRSRLWCHLIYDCNAEAKSERKNLWLGFSFKREASVRCFCRKAVLVSLFYCILRENPWHFLLVSSVLEPPNWVSRLKIRIDKQKKHWRVSQIILVPFDFRPRFGPRRPSLMPTIYVAYMPRRGPKLLGSSWGPFLVEWPKNPFQEFWLAEKEKEQ